VKLDLGSRYTDAGASLAIGNARGLLHWRKHASKSGNDIKAFVPAKDLNVSKAFYTDLGFAIQWSNEEIAELQIGSFGSYYRSSTLPNTQAIS
jgi:hypothetical protein